MSIDVTETDWDTRYSEGYDDGYAGHSRKSDDSAYLSGYFDGLDEAEEEEEWDDYDYDYSDYSDED